MKYRLLDILACPMCKGFPLELIVLEKEKKERQLPSKPPLCELYCAYKGKSLEELKARKEAAPCEECFQYEITTAVLYCRNCGRWFPVINGIPHMLPDYIRKDEKERELEFLRKYADRLPEKIVKKGLPHNLSEENK
ncbi:MAG: Trm112 family protein [Thermoprotei archaeon]|jgi:uncharacterized protein YbaR (Trm112 family)|uniref:Trm112 family protein n=1 Tax=Fervidicoccus fontis TaxID=683846 RepID=A0A7J3SM00_9CREN|nr:Trm112 family protein [Thermoprotei archaeon]